MDYAVTVDEIEEKAGTNFFPELTERKQQNLESKKRDFQFNEVNY